MLICLCLCIAIIPIIRMQEVLKFTLQENKKNSQKHRFLWAIKLKVHFVKQ